MISKPKITRAILLLQQEGLGKLVRKGLSNFVNLWFPKNPKEYLFAYKVLSSYPRSKVMVDVGAATGTVLSPFADSDWKVFAFEPNNRNRNTLTRIFGEHKNVVIDQRAISNITQSNVEFYSSELSSGISGLSAFHQSHRPNGTVDTITLGEYSKEIDIHDIDFLKIDTEGYDLFVLEGFPWNRIQPRIIICEFEDAKSIPLGYAWTDIAAFLDGKGYKIIVSEWFPIVQYGGSYLWRRFVEFPCSLGDPNAWGNFIASNEPMIFDKLVEQCRKFEKRRSPFKFL